MIRILVFILSHIFFSLKILSRVLSEETIHVKSTYSIPLGRKKPHIEPSVVNRLSAASQRTRGIKMAVALPPLRSLQDFVTDAQFTAPTLHDTDRMENRMINNLVYYQTNYFLSAIIIFILVG